MAKALVIDANAQDLLLCERALAEQDFEVKGCGDGNEGLALVRSWGPDVIVLAVELQGSSGYSVCNKLKKDLTLARIPLVLTSSGASEETFAQHRRLRTHADSYVRKPLSKQALWTALEALLDGSAAQAADAEADESTHATADDALLVGLEEDGAQPVGPVGSPPAPHAAAAAPPTQATPATAADEDDSDESKTVVRRALPQEVAATLPIRSAASGPGRTEIDSVAQMASLREQLAQAQAQRAAALQQQQALTQRLEAAELQVGATAGQLRQYQAQLQAARQALAGMQQALQAD